MTVYLDRDQRNADWIKTVSWEYPTDVEHFLHFIGGPQALEHFLTLPAAEAMPPTLRFDLAVSTGVKIPMKAKDYTEALHPRDSQGQFTRKPGGLDTLVDTPHTTAELHDTYVHGVENYQRLAETHGGGMPARMTAEGVYSEMNIDEAKPEDVTPEQRKICEKAAADFLADPKMQPLFDAYGTPKIAVASRVVGADSMVGDDPRDGGVQAQWSNGTIFLYGGVAGDPAYAAELQSMAPKGFNVGGAKLDVTMEHEYGHQVMGVLITDNLLPQFIDALTERHVNIPKANIDQISGYAAYAPSEAFAECFALLMQPDFNIEDYHGGARDALQLLADRIAADTKPTVDPNQETLFA